MAETILDEIYYDLEYFQGDGVYQEFYYGPEDAPIDVSGWQFRMRIKHQYADPTAEALFYLTTENNGFMILDAAQGHVAFRITASGPDGTAAKIVIPYADFSPKKVPFLLCAYDIEAIPPGAEPYKILVGKIKFYGEVTT